MLIDALFVFLTARFTTTYIGSDGTDDGVPSFAICVPSRYQVRTPDAHFSPYTRHCVTSTETESPRIVAPAPKFDMLYPVPPVSISSKMSTSGGQLNDAAIIQNAGHAPESAGAFSRHSAYPYWKLNDGFDWIIPDVYGRPPCTLSWVAVNVSVDAPSTDRPEKS